MIFSINWWAESKNRAQYLPYNTLEDIHHVVLLWDGERSIGCAAFKEYDRERAEVKRVFLCREYRGKGLGRQLLETLEALARQKGYAYLILESGEPLTAAMKLYRSMGYEVIPNYGPYVGMPESVCMEKKTIIPFFVISLLTSVPKPAIILPS